MSDRANKRAAPPSDAVRWPVAIARKFGRVIPEAVERFFADQCSQQAAGIAYRVLFSIAPLAIVLVSIFGLVLQDDSIRQDVVNSIVDALPVSVAGRHDVEDAITAIATPASAAGLVQVQLSAIALSVKPGGRIGSATIGKIATRGDNLVSVEIDGEIGSLTVAGGMHADGRGSDGIHVREGGIDLSGAEVTAANGQPIVRRPPDGGRDDG